LDKPINDGWGIPLSGFTAEWSIPKQPPHDAFIGGRLRGILGHALFSQVCPFPVAKCADCALAAYCDYTCTFKPLAPTALPAYILHDWQVHKKTISVTLLLMGNASQSAENWIRGLFSQLPRLDWWGQSGMRLQKVTDWQSGNKLFANGRFAAQAQLTFACRWPLVDSDVSVNFITPLLSKHQHGDPLMAALKTRVQRLRNQFGDAGVFDVSHSLWHCQINSGQQVNLHWRGGQRKLTASHYHLILTQLTDSGSALLGAGLWLHAGGQTGLGLGNYRLEPTDAVGRNTDAINVRGRKWLAGQDSADN